MLPCGYKCRSLPDPTIARKTANSHPKQCHAPRNCQRPTNSSARNSDAVCRSRQMAGQAHVLRCRCQYWSDSWGRFLRIHHTDVLVSQHCLQWNDGATELSHPTCLSMPQPSDAKCYRVALSEDVVLDPRRKEYIVSGELLDDKGKLVTGGKTSLFEHNVKMMEKNGVIPACAVVDCSTSIIRSSGVTRDKGYLGTRGHVVSSPAKKKKQTAFPLWFSIG